MSVTREEIRMHLLKPIQEQDGNDVITDVLALWCQHWEVKLKAMSKEERRAFLKTKGARSSWHYIVEIIEEKEAKKE